METTVTDSILTSTKKLLGLMSDYTAFDSDIIMHINAALQTLRQIGVGPKYGFIIHDDTSTYQDLLGDNVDRLSSVKLFIYYRVRLGWDPPQSSSVLSSMKELLAEETWRLNAEVDPYDTFE